MHPMVLSGPLGFGAYAFLSSIPVIDWNEEGRVGFRAMTHRTAAVIGGIGRTLIAMGLLTLAFAGFQLWGTGLQETRAQDSLESDFEEQLASIQELTEELDETDPADSSTTTTPTNDAEPVSTDPSENTDSDNPVIAAPQDSADDIDPALVALLTADQGAVMGSINIPAIDMSRHIVEGVARPDLRKGPGHYSTSPLPGQPGNAAIAGHRTTYGSPFGDLDLLEPGDEILVTTLQGNFVYEVMPQPNDEGDEIGHFIVSPNQVEILQDFGDNRLTLTACHPKYSARQRIVVTALLVEEPAPLLPTTVPDPAAAGDETDAIDELALDEGNVIGIEENALDEALGWNYAERTPTILWGLVTALVAAVAIGLGRVWKRWPSYALATPGFLVALFVCFSHLDRLLPAL